MSYRPITDVMILARSKTKYYGAFPAGFLSRARWELGCGPHWNCRWATASEQNYNRVR